MKRYSMGFFKGAPAMFEQPDGEYVRWSDVQQRFGNVRVVFGEPQPNPPCVVCGMPYEKHGSYPTCADHHYSASAIPAGVPVNLQRLTEGSPNV